MKVIIIEDERLSSDYLINILNRIDSTIEVINVLESVKDSIIAFNQTVSADLIFADIHLSDGISFDIFSKINVEIPIIFTTAYDHYAIKAFKLNSIDYLLKPIGIDELKNAIDKHKKYSGNLNLDNLSNQYQYETKLYKNRFIVKIGDNISSIKTDEISHFLSEDGVVLLVTFFGKKYIVDYNLDQLELLIPPTNFYRLNRKVIASLNSIQKTNSFFNSRLKVKIEFLNEESSIVSRERVIQFKKWLDGEL
ncbi:MAG: response regulator transcription factor [Flavobacteriia bacterium]|nr:response regulator transcription factor [Flavobacteriia bacterium]